MKITNNIIANNCTGARMMRKLNLPNANPFCWTIIDFNAIKTILTQFNKINWLNFRYTSKIADKSHPVCHGIVVDERFTLWFPHLKQDNNCVKPQKRDLDIYVKDVKKYITETYKRRAERMIALNITPTFIISENVGFNYIVPILTAEQLIELDRLQDKYDVCFAVFNHLKDIPLKNKVEESEDTMTTANTVLGKYRRDVPTRTEKKTESKPRQKEPTPPKKPKDKPRHSNGRLSMAFYNR